MRRTGGSGRVVTISGIPYGVREHQIPEFVADRFFDVAGSINYKYETLENPSPEARRRRSRLPLIAGPDRICILPSLVASSRFTWEARWTLNSLRYS